MDDDEDVRVALLHDLLCSSKKSSFLDVKLLVLNRVGLFVHYYTYKYYIV